MRRANRTRRRSQRGGVLRRVIGVVVVLVLLVAAGVLLVQHWPGTDNDGTATSQTPTSTPPPLREPEPPGPGFEFEKPAAAAPVLAAVDTRSVSAAQVRQRLAALVRDKSLGNHFGFVVEQLGARRPLMTRGEPDLVTPASTQKLLTTASALQVLGPQHRFPTTVVRGTSKRSVVLVGGGDPLLTDREFTPAQTEASYPRPASLEELAAHTARALRKSGIDSIRLGYDDTLFSGPAVSPRWEPGYIPDVVSPISALWTNEGRVAAGNAQRVPNSAASAADQFADLLSQEGISVTGSVTRQPTKQKARTIAEVRSPPLAAIVQHILELSDNEGAEVLLRQVGLATGRPGSFVGGVAGLRKTLSGLGMNLSRATIYDGSGLSRDDRIPVGLLVEVLQTSAAAAYPNLRSVISTLPVAGFSGSLDYRFVGDAPAGLGLVRAKTGTLTGVHAYAGIVLTRDETALVFAAVADRVPVARTLDARAQLDRIGAALATCGC